MVRNAVYFPNIQSGFFVDRAETLVKESIEKPHYVAIQAYPGEAELFILNILEDSPSPPPVLLSVGVEFWGWLPCNIRDVPSFFSCSCFQLLVW